MSVRLDVRARRAATAARASALRGPVRQRLGHLVWLAPYWLGALGLAYGVYTDRLPIRRWLLLEPAPAATERQGAVLARQASLLLPTWDSTPEPAAAKSADSLEDGAAAAVQGVAFAAELAEEPTPAIRSDSPVEQPPESSGQRVALSAFRPLFEPALGRHAHERGHTPSRRPVRQGPAAPEEVLLPGLASLDEALHAASERIVGLSARRDALGPGEEPTATDEPGSGAGHSGASKHAWNQASAGQSCAAAQAAYQEQIQVGEAPGAPDLSSGRYAAVLNAGGYFRHCAVAASTGIRICAAVQHGHAQGVTVWTSPPDARAGQCIANAVRALAFPSHSHLDVVTTSFAPAR